MLAEIETLDDSLRIILNGRLTFAENGEFRRVVDALGRDGASAVVFDMAGLDFIDSAGMGMLLVARDQVAARGGRIALRAAAGQVGRMLELAKFADFFTMEQ